MRSSTLELSIEELGTQPAEVRWANANRLDRSVVSSTNRAQRGDAKAAYQMGVISLSEDATHGPDGIQAARWWKIASDAGHPLAATRLAQLYAAGGHGLPPDRQQAEYYKASADRAGL